MADADDDARRAVVRGVRDRVVEEELVPRDPEGAAVHERDELPRQRAGLRTRSSVPTVLVGLVSVVESDVVAMRPGGQGGW